MINKDKLKDILLKIKYQNKWLIECSTYTDLCNDNFLLICEPIKHNKIKYFNYLKKTSEVIFNYEDYDNIFKCINFLLEHNITNIRINVGNKKGFCEWLIKNEINYELLDSVKLSIDFRTLIDFKTLLEKEKTLYTMIKSAINLSPLEKFIYAYNITKKFKEYNENEEDKSCARDLYKILENEYIVCVGYVRLLKNLLDLLDIKSTELTIDVLDLDDIKSSHMRLYVYLKDKKYDIDGFYLSDPTWDNNFKYDLYNYLLFTNKKNDYNKIYFLLNENLLFNVDSLYEFNRNFDVCKDKLKETEIYLINYLLEIISKLNPDYMKYLKDKYNFINCSNYILNFNDDYKKLVELRNELGNYIVGKVNKEIDNKKIERAIKEIYVKSYGFKNKKDLNNYLERVFKYNKIVDEHEFPNKYKMDLDENKKLIKKLY